MAAEYEVEQLPSGEWGVWKAGTVDDQGALTSFPVLATFESREAAQAWVEQRRGADQPT